ncbi:MAG TPA: polysaccharide biosynthesis tyrosine autokinase [Acidimicrobiales bacterium]|nr:polysaccharide biosynthesis tyrosine autokinase [Acidimicrobiales bacterium]
MEPNGGEGGTDLVTYLRVLWRRKWIVLLAIIVAVAGVLAVDSQRTKIYQGTATILFVSQNYVGPGEVSPLQSNDILTDIQLVQSASDYLHVVKLLHGSAPKPIVAQVGTTNTATVSVNSPDAAFAAKAANAYARAYTIVSESQYLATQKGVESQIQTQIDSLQSQISAVEAQLGTATGTPLANLNTQLGNLQGNLDSLRAQLTQVQVEVAQTPSGGRVVTQATLNRTTVSPKPVTDAIIFGLIGLVLGIALALLRDLTDDRVRDKATLDQLVGGLPTLGLIPRVEEWRNKRTPLLVSALEPRSAPAEAYRGLRTSIQFLGMGKPVKTLQITSPIATEGKTTTAANLAATMAQTGQRVVLVSCDLRRPRVHEFFDLPNDVGFTSIIVGDATLEEALVQVPGYSSLHFLPSGPIPPNPSELLGLDRALEIFSTLRAQADIVIVDSPPVMPVTDASVLAATVDGVLLIVSANSTKKRDVRHAIETLGRVDARVVGVVLNGSSEADSYGYYRYGYRPKKEPKAPAASSAR